VPQPTMLPHAPSYKRGFFNRKHPVCSFGWDRAQPWCHLTVLSVLCIHDHIHRGCCLAPSRVSYPRSSLPSCRKLQIFLSRRPTELVMCQDGILLGQ
jgi:hypothetical protein